MSAILSFEHFDPDLELGNILDENGKPIKPRKKPGRKPNPPSPAQRKAQNRAAQRAFRERKRREMREAEMMVNKCIYARDQALKQVKRLKKRMEELVYETNYLKGYTLTLKMACVANHIEVPKFWDTGLKDEIGADEMSFSKTKGIPQQLELFLDKSFNIINIDQEVEQDVEPPSAILNSPSTSSDSSFSSDLLMQSMHEDENESQDFILDNNALSTIAPELANHLETPFFQELLKTDLIMNNSISLSSSGNSNDGQEEAMEEDDEEEIEFIDAKTGILRKTTPTIDYTGSPGSINKDKQLFPPMTPLDAIKKMRSIKNLDETTRTLFTPTELQSNIRHDTRIDIIPSPALRDHMILYQDYYNSNELFDYLLENSVFLGGELGNIDNWFVPPNFFKKYWFLCPNHKHERVDNIVEVMVQLNKKMINIMLKRKQMYNKRDMYPDYFPTTSIQSDDLMDYFNEEFLQEQTSPENMPSPSQHLNLLSNDLPLDHFITTMLNT